MSSRHFRQEKPGKKTNPCTLGKAKPDKIIPSSLPSLELVLSKKIKPEEIKPSNFLSLEEMQCQMGEARTNRGDNAK
jgi:hypothetical protein